MKCRYCREDAVEHATTTDHKTVSSDCCYGCRNRHYEVRRQLELAAAALADARELAGREETDLIGQEVAGLIGRIEAELTDVRRWHDEFPQPEELIAGVKDALAALSDRAD